LPVPRRIEYGMYTLSVGVPKRSLKSVPPFCESPFEILKTFDDEYKRDEAKLAGEGTFEKSINSSLSKACCAFLL
jgi:hypothetical protein